MVFSYFIFIRVVLYFLSNLSAGIALNLWSINKFFSFIFITCLSFGIIFQLPLFLLILNKLNIVNLDTLRKQRKYIYVLIFILAALVTPPDAITQLIQTDTRLLATSCPLCKITFKASNVIPVRDIAEIYAESLTIVLPVKELAEEESMNF